MSIRSRERGEERRVEIDCCSGLICMVRCEMCRLVSSYVSSSCFCLIVSSSRRSLGVSRLPDGIFSHDPDTGMTSNDVRCQNVLLKYEYIYIYTYAYAYHLALILFVEGELMTSSILGRRYQIILCLAWALACGSCLQENHAQDREKIMFLHTHRVFNFHDTRWRIHCLKVENGAGDTPAGTFVTKRLLLVAFNGVICCITIDLSWRKAFNEWLYTWTHKRFAMISTTKCDWLM